MDNRILNGDEINLRELFKSLSHKKITVTLIIFLFTSIFAVYSLFLPNIYTSSAIVKMTKENQGSNFLSQYEGIASLAGVNIPSQLDSVLSPEYVSELIKSRSFLNRIISKSDIMPGIFAAQSFDINNQKIIYSNAYDSNKNQWNKSYLEGKSSPSLLDVHKKFIKNNLEIDIDPKTDFITLRVSHVSPIFAKYLLTQIIDEVNLQEKQKAQEKATLLIAFLQEQLKKINYAALKDSFNSVLERQIETLMFSEVISDYLIEVIDAPFVPEEKSAPSRLLIALIGSILGLVFSIFYVLARKD